MNKTGIEWTDSTWNPIRGCSRVSEGCRNCYAESVAYRFSGPGKPYEGLVTIGPDGERRRQWNGQVQFIEKHLLDPLKWKEPRRIFVNSMSDLFHPNVRDEWIDKIFAVMALCPQHTFQVLTKRPERMLEYLGSDLCRINVLYRVLVHRNRDGAKRDEFREWPLPNVWLGVSCEDQQAADKRIPLLLQTPAAKRFISAEPLLGPIDLSYPRGQEGFGHLYSSPNRTIWKADGSLERIPRLDWVIVGGESGPEARPMRAEWAKSLRDQCQAAGVAFFFKQWGEWLGEMQDGPRREDGASTINASDEPVRVGKRLAGALLDGREWREFPRGE